MNRNLLTTILLLVCFNFLAANNSKPKLYLVYSEYCSYSQDLIQNTIADKNVQEELNNIEFILVEENSLEAKTIIERYKIKGFPTQVLLNKEKAVLAYGTLSVNEQLQYLKSQSDLQTILNQTENFISFQETEPFEKYVFRETGLGYNQKTKEILTPTIKKAYNSCRKEEKPDHYVCGGNGGASYTFIEKGEKTKIKRLED